MTTIRGQQADGGRQAQKILTEQPQHRGANENAKDHHAQQGG